MCGIGFDSIRFDSGSKERKKRKGKNSHNVIVMCFHTPLWFLFSYAPTRYEREREEGGKGKVTEEFKHKIDRGGAQTTRVMLLGGRDGGQGQEGQGAGNAPENLVLRVGRWLGCVRGLCVPWRCRWFREFLSFLFIYF